jgi:hypothetical protein
MSIRQKTILGLALFSLLFAGLIVYRDASRPPSHPAPAGGVTVQAPPANPMDEHESWMRILQRDRPIGYSHRFFQPVGDGYRVTDSVVMRINTMGVEQQIRITTASRLHHDLSLASFAFSMESGLFSFSAEGTVAGKDLLVTTGLSGDEQTHRIPLENTVMLGNGIFQSLARSNPLPGSRMRFDVFDPATLSNTTVTVDVGGEETVSIGKKTITATHVRLAFRGMQQEAWFDEKGDVVKESGLLGIVMVRSTREEATRAAYGQASEDLTLLASVPVDADFGDPAALKMLKVRITGVDREGLMLHGGRQFLAGDTLTIRREGEDGTTWPAGGKMPEKLRPFLEASPFIQAGHERIRSAVRQVIGRPLPLPGEELTAADRRQRAQTIVAWVHEHIRQRPVLSVPDAISTLDNKVGDCNEHAVLTAALARAAGVPARVEAGLVYMKGRFFYHAWNSFYLDNWTTADTIFGQMPADVTHIRLISGSADGQLNLMGVFGKINLEVLEYHHD